MAIPTLLEDRGTALEALCRRYCFTTTDPVDEDFARHSCFRPQAEREAESPYGP